MSVNCYMKDVRLLLLLKLGCIHLIHRMSVRY